MLNLYLRLLSLVSNDDIEALHDSFWTDDYRVFYALAVQYGVLRVLPGWLDSEPLELEFV